MHTLPPHRWYHPDNCFSYRHPLSSLFPSFSPSRNSFLEIQYISPGYFFANSNCEVWGPRAGCANAWNPLPLLNLCHSVYLDKSQSGFWSIFLLVTFSSRKTPENPGHASSQCHMSFDIIWKKYRSCAEDFSVFSRVLSHEEPQCFGHAIPT